MSSLCIRCPVCVLDALFVYHGLVVYQMAWLCIRWPVCVSDALFVYQMPCFVSDAGNEQCWWAGGQQEYEPRHHLPPAERRHAYRLLHHAPHGRVRRQPRERHPWRLLRRTSVTPHAVVVWGEHCQLSPSVEHTCTCDAVLTFPKHCLLIIGPFNNR